MTLDMSEWSQLEQGLYLHRFKALMIVVPAELPLPPWFRDQILRHDLEFWREAIWKHALRKYDEVQNAGIELSDVVIQEVTSYVV